MEEVAEELELHLVWEDHNVNERANWNGPEANEDLDMARLDLVRTNNCIFIFGAPQGKIFQVSEPTQ